MQATNFMLSCYGHPECTSLTDARQKIWSWKVSQRTGAAPKLQKLPPTNEALAENVVRAHIQVLVATWKHVIHLNLSNMDPLTHMEGQDVTVPVAHLRLLLLFLTMCLLLLIQVLFYQCYHMQVQKKWILQC